MALGVGQQLVRIRYNPKMGEEGRPGGSVGRRNTRLTMGISICKTAIINKYNSKSRPPSFPPFVRDVSGHQIPIAQWGAIESPAKKSRRSRKKFQSEQIESFNFQHSTKFVAHRQFPGCLLWGIQHGCPNLANMPTLSPDDSGGARRSSTLFVRSVRHNLTYRISSQELKSIEERLSS
jgi:hypothetical protein